MFRIDTPTAAESLPAPGDAGTPGYFTGGDPQQGVPATHVSPDFMNTIQEELLAVILDAGLSPDKANRAQLLAAINAKIATARKISLLALASDAPIPNNVLTDVGWGSAPINDLGAWSAGAPTKLVVPAGCTMARISAQAVYYANATGQRYLRIEPTVSRGVSFEANIFPNSTASGGAVQVTTPLLPVTPGEEWKVQTSQGSGVSLSMILGRCWAVMEAY